MRTGQKLADRAFPTTHWSLVLSAGKGATEPLRREAVAKLLERYTPALRAYLRSRGYSEDRTDDLLQSFLTDNLIAGGLIASADRTRGRFRALLLTAARNFVAKQARRDRALVRSPGTGKLRRWEDTTTAAPAAAAAADPFDVAWAREVLAEALRRMTAECRAVGRPDVWDVFYGRVVSPATEGSEPVPYKALVHRHGFKSMKQAFNVLITGKRAFERVLRSVISEYAASDEEVEDEIRSLKEVLSMPRHASQSVAD